MLKSLIRPAMLFVPFVLGAFFPEAHHLNDAPIHFIRRALTVMVFLSCLQIRLSDLKPRREHWSVLGINLLMGVAPYLLLRFLLPQHPECALIAFFVGITPTATSAPVVISFLHGRVGFALTGFTLTNVAISLALLVLLPLIMGDVSSDFFFDVCGMLFRIIAVPFLVALLLRRIWPGIRNLPSKCKYFSLTLWSANLFIMAAVARQYFIDNPEQSFLRIAPAAAISLAICAANFFIGGRIARLRYRRESSQILGQKNTMFTMFLSLHYAGPFVAMGPIFYILWHNLWNAFQMYRYDRRQLRKAVVAQLPANRRDQGDPREKGA